MSLAMWALKVRVVFVGKPHYTDIELFQIGRVVLTKI